MPVNDELVELACAAEQGVSGTCKWPDDWNPELADEYRESMRAFLASIVPFIESAALEVAARVAEDDGASGTASADSEGNARIAAAIRARIRTAGVSGWPPEWIAMIAERR